MKTKIKSFPAYSLFVASGMLAVSMCGCESKQDKINDAQKSAQSKLDDANRSAAEKSKEAQQNVANAQADALKKLATATAQVAEAKIDGEKKVDDATNK